MALLGKAAILAAADLPHEDVPVPEWGGTVRVRAMSGKDRDDHDIMARDAVEKSGAMGNWRARFCAMVMVDESGARLFPDVSDVESLGSKSAAALDRVYDVGRRLSGLTREAEAAAEKNSLPGPSAGPTSESPAN